MGDWKHTQEKQKEKKKELKRIREKHDISTRKLGGTKEYNGQLWSKSAHTEYWFLHGIGYAVLVGDTWEGGLLYKRMKPRKKIFLEMEEAMDWVFAKGGDMKWGRPTEKSSINLKSARCENERIEI